jgi:chromate transporter
MGEQFAPVTSCDGAAEGRAAVSPNAGKGSLTAFLRYFLYLGTVGFGGPIALVGYMQRDLVDERHWISAEDYKEGLALAQLAPGPLAAQLAMYLGWVRARLLGATLTGVAFIGPSFVMVLVLSALYVRFGGLPWMRGVFYGVGAAVIAIIARSAVKLTRLTAKRDALLWSIVVVNAAATAWAQAEIVWVLLASGVTVLVIRWVPTRREASRAALALFPSWLLTGLHGVAPVSLTGTITWFFAKAGSVVFGSGLAVVPFLYGGVVQQYHWLTEQQFLDAVAVSMITPGPVVITVAFIGYLVAGPLGAIAAAVGVFVPVYLVVALVAPYFKRLVGNPALRAFVDGVTAAATGAILGAVIVLARRALVDVATVAICLATLFTVLCLRRVPEPLAILAAGVVGVVVKSFAIGGSGQ